MAYSIYQTDCLVLGIRELQEHDLMLRVFSPMFGYTRIIVKSARKSTSKLRANIKEYSLAHVAMVKGKEFFILTDIKCIFSFVQSKSVVMFLKSIEGLFFDDENDHGENISSDIYTMLLRMCKLIIWVVSEKKDVAGVQSFFTVYVRGLQGFGEKIIVPEVVSMIDTELYKWLTDNKENISKLKDKII